METEEEKSFEFPKCWEDDMRMNSLFAPFRARNINPTDWDSKMKFWESLVEQWCTHHKAPIIEVPVWINNFRRNGQVPSSLPEVMNHLQRNKVLVTKNSFYQMTEQSWKNWAVQILFKNPLQWTFNKVKNTIISNNGNQETLIHLPTVKKLAAEIMQKVPESEKGKLITLNYLQDISKIKSLEVLELIVHWLHSEKSLAVNQEGSCLLVKLPKDKNLSITDLDKAMYFLQRNKQIIKNNVTKIEKEKENFLNEAKKHVASKNTVMAKSSLRKKRKAENLLEKLTSALDKIESLIYEIQMAEMNSLVLDSYHTGVTALKKIFSENNLTTDRIESTKNELDDVLITNNAINNIISNNFNTNSSEDNSWTDELLEEELNSILQGSQSADSSTADDKQEETDSLLAKLPDVPSSSLKMSDEVLSKKLATLAI